MERGLSQTALARLCGLSAPSYICEVEKGTRNVSYACALAFERELGIPVEAFGFDRATGRRGAPTGEAAA